MLRSNGPVRGTRTVRPAFAVGARVACGGIFLRAGRLHRQIVRRECGVPMDLDGDSQLHRACGIVTVRFWAKR